MHDQYYSGDIAEQIRSKGYAGVIPDDPLEQILLFKKLQQIDEEVSIKNSETQKKSEKSKNNNLILNQHDKDKLIINIEILGWKGHENYSMEQLMDLNEAIDNYFTIYDYCNQYDIWITPKSLKKYTLENLKQINQEFEKKVLNKEVRKKRTKKTEWENKAITNPKDIDKIKIRKQIKEFLTIDVSEIHNNDLNSLKNKIDKLKIIEPNIKVSSLKNATLLLLNYEIESYNGEKESNIDDARKSINCHKSKIIIKEKYPEIDLPENCDDIIKIFNKKIVPKDFPDMVVTQEKIDQWKQEIKDKGDNSGDMLYENSNKDMK